MEIFSLLANPIVDKFFFGAQKNFEYFFAGEFWLTRCGCPPKADGTMRRHVILPDSRLLDVRTTALEQYCAKAAGLVLCEQSAGQKAAVCLVARSLAFDWNEPWQLTANFNRNFNHLNGERSGAKRKRPPAADENFFENRGQLEELWSLWSQARTFFISNWDKWQEIETSDWCAENSIGKMAKEDGD